jgi:hypothetical protein
MKTLVGTEVKLRAFITSVINGGDWIASNSCRNSPRGKSHRYPLHRRLAGLRVAQAVVAKRKVFAPARNPKPIMLPASYTH